MADSKKPEHYIYALLVFVAASENEGSKQKDKRREAGTNQSRIGN